VNVKSSLIHFSLSFLNESFLILLLFQVNQSWKKRWFVLTDVELSYYDNCVHDSIPPRGSIPIQYDLEVELFSFLLAQQKE
jgi:hypothetical protein